MGFDMADYVDVAERIATFREKHPEGSLQSDVIHYPDESFAQIVVKAYAYRTPDDIRPGVGLAGEPVPGPTQFTKNSELQNAETAAWGRAIVAALAADTKRGVASADEVRNRSTSTEAEARPEPASPPVSDWVDDAAETFGEGELIDAAEAVRQEMGVGSQITGLGGVRKVVEGSDPHRRIIERLDKALVRNVEAS